MWSIRDGTCVKSLEGSDSSILSLVWNETGDRLISTGSDGIIRLWDLGKAETTDVLEAHDERCWSLIKMKDSIISAGADGQVIIWEDISETVYVEQQQDRDFDEKISTLPFQAITLDITISLWGNHGPEND